MKIALCFTLALLILLTSASNNSTLSDDVTSEVESMKQLEEETETIIRGIMDAFGNTFSAPLIDDIGKGDDVIVQQEEKITDSEGNVKIKQRTLTNPSKEELETKTLDELEDDVDDPTITTIQSIRLKLNDNDMSDHAFSTFGLTDPKNADEMRQGGSENNSSYVKESAWFVVKIVTVLAIGFAIFKAFRLGSKLKNTFMSLKSKRRYDKKDDDEINSDEGDDEEELRNIRNAVRRGEKTFD
mmetsp:Transcript_25275/g.22397  ORF Transcript_25275/g.22397 Transcript_25275/m.22397 type:complete len:242 (+) Transcript_25275:23-748(+)